MDAALHFIDMRDAWGLEPDVDRQDKNAIGCRRRIVVQGCTTINLLQAASISRSDCIFSRKLVKKLLWFSTGITVRGRVLGGMLIRRVLKANSEEIWG